MDRSTTTGAALHAEAAGAMDGRLASAGRLVDAAILAGAHRLGTTNALRCARLGAIEFGADVGIALTVLLITAYAAHRKVAAQGFAAGAVTMHGTAADVAAHFPPGGAGVILGVGFGGGLDKRGGDGGK